MPKYEQDKGRKPDDPRDDGPGGGNHGGGGPSHDRDDHGPGGDDHGHDKTIVVFVNEKPVTVEKERMTGLAIKQAAIAQGVYARSLQGNAASERAVALGAQVRPLAQLALTYAGKARG